MNRFKLILASGSLYKKQLLEKLKLDFISDASDIDENSCVEEIPEQKAIRLAIAKATALTPKYSDALIIGSDQVAMLGDLQLCKAGNRENAINQLIASSGRHVDFYTAVSVVNSNNSEYLYDIDKCTVYFKNLSKSQIEHYVDIEKPFDCAGSFKSEGLGIVLFKRIQTDDPNALIGLPLIRLINLLKHFGVNPI